MTRLFVPKISMFPESPEPGDIVGYTKSGKPIALFGGGAPVAANVDSWIPIEYDSDVVQRVLAESTVERYGRRYLMGTNVREIPRSAGLTVQADETYVDDASANDKVNLTARRFISRFSVDEDDLADANSRMDVIRSKGLDWAISYADTFDNACIATTGAESGIPANHRPFTSIYKALRTTDGTVYTADANYLTWSGTDFTMGVAGTSSYEKFSALFALIEGGKYWSQADMLVIAHPRWRDVMRRTVDGNKQPVFKESAGVDSVTGRSFPDMLFNTPISWSRGAKTDTSGAATDSPNGNDLLAYVNTRFLARGDRSGPEVLTDNARAQDDTDTFSVKFRTRRGFKLTMQKAAAVLERLA